MRYEIWEDGKEKHMFDGSDNGFTALDQAANQIYGFVDYADMAQARGWREDEGLNIVQIQDLDTEQQ